MTPQVAIVWGPTASGKTALSLALAARLDAEIISADSRQIYRGMDIGTAKAMPAERAGIRHHLIDICAPDEPFGLADFLTLAHAAVREITARGRPAIITGGTGQYLRALLEGWQAPAVAPNPVLRRQLQERAAAGDAAALHEELAARDPAAAGRIDPRNLRRVIRALEVIEATGRPFSAQQRRAPPPFTAIMIGLRVERHLLYERIDRRVEEMFAAGLVGEVESLLAAGYGCHLPALQSIGYAEVCSFLRGDFTLGEAIARTKTGTHRLARMQAAWFRQAEPAMTWLEAGADPPVQRAIDVLLPALGGTD